MICRPVANYRQIGRHVPTGGFLGVMQLQKKKRSKTAFFIPMYFNKGSFWERERWPEHERMPLMAPWKIVPCPWACALPASIASWEWRKETKIRNGYHLMTCIAPKNPQKYIKKLSTFVYSWCSRRPSSLFCAHGAYVVDIIQSWNRVGHMGKWASWNVKTGSMPWTLLPGNSYGTVRLKRTDTGKSPPLEYAASDIS